jgi:uncharacterized protein (UPF0335 family)
MASLNMNTADGKKLRQMIESIEKLNEDYKGIADDIRDKFAEAKGLGFDTKVMRKVIALRKKSKSERDEEDAILTVYLGALGMLGTELGNWADEQERGEAMPGRVVAAA